MTVTITYFAFDVNGNGILEPTLDCYYSLFNPQSVFVSGPHVIRHPHGQPFVITDPDNPGLPGDVVKVCPPGPVVRTAEIDLLQFNPNLLNVGETTLDFAVVNLVVDPSSDEGSPLTSSLPIFAGILPAGSLSVCAGCTVSEKNTVLLHTVELATGFSTKKPLQGVQARVFEGVGNPPGSLYGQIFEASGKIAECTTGTGGVCITSEQQAGQFLVIVKHVDAVNGKIVYEGSTLSPTSFRDTNGDGIADFAELKFEITRANRDGAFFEYRGGSKTLVVACGGDGQPVCE